MKRNSLDKKVNIKAESEITTDHSANPLGIPNWMHFVLAKEIISFPASGMHVKQFLSGRSCAWGRKFTVQLPADEGAHFLPTPALLFPSQPWKLFGIGRSWPEETILGNQGKEEENATPWRFQQTVESRQPNLC